MQVMPMTWSASNDFAPYEMALKELPFDTEVMGAPVFRLSLGDAADGTDIARDLDAWRVHWTALGAWLVMCRVDRVRPDADAWDAALTKAGFVEVETLLTFERPLGPSAGPRPASVVSALPEHLADCALIAGEAFVSSRYHTDGRIKRERADELKRRWVRNSFAGRAEAILVALDTANDNGVAGFNALRLDGETAVIDLIAVDRLCRRRGVGKDLVDAALCHFAGKASRLRVGTQAANLPSQALYRRCGFAEIGAAKTFHWIRPDRDRAGSGVA